MKNLCLAVLCLIFLIPLHSKADDVLLPFGQNLAGAPAWRYKGGGTNLDGQPWRNLVYAEPSWVTGNSALGFGANPPVRNTAIPENTTAGGGGVSGARYRTLYFRKVLNIANPAIYNSFTINTKFDDGIVIWINGQEAYRNNINANPVYNDLAPTAITGNGSVIYTGYVPVSMFVTGDNIIAVEIHQNAVTSTDLFFDMELIGVNTAPTLTRGPYLQSGKQDSITIRWRTSAPSDSKVGWGTVHGTYPNSITKDAVTPVTDHIVRIGTLTADTKYYYTIGGTSFTLQSGVDNYFQTLPLDNTTRKLRFLAIGDCGNNSANQVNVKNTFKNFIGSNDVDAMILLGDNAYSFGTDAEYQTNFFNIYQGDILKYYKMYPSPGNHDYANNPDSTGSRVRPYHLNFTVPMSGEIGGVPSGKSNYYSFNVGDVHFISLDSYGRDNNNTTKMYDTLGEQAMWLKADLAANTKKWTIAYFHHPPYTKTSHTSDTETDLIAIRERFIRILERNGVDLVLCGHSHGYERSYLLKGFYNTVASPMLDANFNEAVHTPTGNLLNGKYDATGALSCPYTYNSGKYNHGTIYTVAGSAGQLGGTTAGYPQNCMYYSNVANGGSYYIEVDSNRMDVKFVSYSGTSTPVIRDQYTVFKDVNKTTNITIAKDAPLTLTASWRGNYYWPNNGGATTQSVSVNTSANGTFVYTVRDANSGSCIQDVFNVTVSGTLPVALISFTATLQKDKVLLDWSTSMEQNNKYFTIERSTDGVHFTMLGKLNGAGNSSIVNNYRMVDFAPANGVNYYRLSQTNYDGHIAYFDTRRVTYKNNTAFSVNIVNVSAGNVNAVINSTNNDQLKLQLVDMLGKERMLESFPVKSGTNIKALQLPAGAYILTLTNSAGERISSKIIVQ